MRISLFVQVLSIAVIVTVGAMWVKSRGTAADLQARLSALDVFRRNTIRALEVERDRLRVALEEANWRRQVDTVAASSAPAQPEPPRPVAPSLVLGEWRASREWRNEGRSTPRGTVATLLWAATGGDVAALTSIIAYDEAAQARAQALFDGLPSNARQAFPTPEALIAGLTIQAVPASGAQLSWFHQRDPDHATVGLLLSAPDQPGPAAAVIVPAEGNNPPGLTDPQATRIAVLSLQRSPAGWNVIIPAAAIDRLATRLKQPGS